MPAKPRAECTKFAHRNSLAILGNGWNTVSRVLFRKRELTDFCGKLGELCEKTQKKLGELALAHEK